MSSSELAELSRLSRRTVKQGNMRHFFISTLLLFSGSISAHAAVDAGLLSYVPADSKTVSSVNLIQARGSDFGQYILARIGSEDEHFQEFVTETGFDPRRDLQAFVLASAGSGPQNHSQSKFIIIARGTADPARITAAAVARGATIRKYSGIDLVLSKSGPHQSGADRSGFAFLDAGIAVMGDIATLEQIVANRSTPTLLDPTLQSRIDAIGATNDAWFVSLSPGGSLAGHITGEAGHSLGNGQAFQSVLQASGGIQFGSTVKLTFDAVTRSPKDATSLADLARFGSSMVQMSRDKNKSAAALATAVDSMDLRTDGNSMYLSLSMPETSLEQLADFAPKHSSRR